ncbi:hypothetical protein HED60_17640 [Planctomycetales bacterium ZRK34]|nr:hypothetical protein HED60_17640 [Planctomycetales bacterium ZRK34]
MMRLLHNLGDALDRIDLGGWMMLGCGFVIVAATALAPAWHDVQSLDIQRRQLRRQVALLQIQEQNYHAFVRALDRNDPLLLQRLAWTQLRHKPVGGTLLMRTTMDPSHAPVASVDQWVQPEPIPMAPVEALHRDNLLNGNSRLMRLIGGPSRPWVLAFGGWLILMSVLLNPSIEED